MDEIFHSCCEVSMVYQTESLPFLSTEMISRLEILLLFSVLPYHVTLFQALPGPNSGDVTVPTESSIPMFCDVLILSYNPCDKMDTGLYCAESFFLKIKINVRGKVKESMATLWAFRR